MKTIVLAADFSESAAQVADYALALAGQLHARLVIVHVYESSADGPTEFSYIPLRLERLRERLMHSSKGSVEVVAVAKYGQPQACIEAVVAEQRADLLIMTLADDRPYTARFLGSLPTDMVPQTAVSMLILPPDVRYKLVKAIVLAVDLSEAIDAVALGSAKAFVQALGASLAIICMEDDPNSQHRESAQRIRGLFDGLPNTFSFLPGNDLTNTLDEYCCAHPTDLIMLLPKHHNHLRLWLLESVTQQVVRQAAVPVLAIV
jgi:nucleotide-binding universal stress UspA family protein